MDNQNAIEPKKAFDPVKYQTDWIRNNVKRYEVRVNINKEADIIAYLNSISNVQSYIKQLIRDDIARHAQEETPHHEKV